ncbi:FtsK/SpoIIIE family protein [Bacteroidales bacterium KA00251]|nr:FtsK/SpoIIIE family protein [Bacteroidales bacterium KA00251]
MTQRNSKVNRPQKRRSSVAAKKKVDDNAERKASRSTLWIQRVREAATHDTAKFIIGVVLLALSLFCFVACLSFIFTASKDQSLVVNDVDVTQLQEGEVQNTFSILGARVSRALVDGFLGVGIFVLLLIPFFLSLKLMGIKKKVRMAKVFVHYTLLALSLSLLSYLVTLPFGEQLTFRWGGMHGDVVGNFLQLYIGTWGLLLVVLVLLVICWVLFRPRGKESVRNVLSFSWVKREKKNVATPQNSASIAQDEVASPQEESECAQDEAGSSQGEECESIPIHGSYMEDSRKERIEELRPEDVDEEMSNPPLERQEAKGESKLVVELANGGVEEEYTRSYSSVKDSREQGDLPNYQFPQPELLDEDNASLEMPDESEIRANEQLIIDTLESFKIKVTPIKATVGPTVTLYEIEPDAGIKISRIRSLEDDIALSLKAEGIRIIAPIPGKGTIGIEVPNAKPKVVGLRSLLTSRKFVETSYSLPVALGRTITNEVFIFDLAKMPHLLIAGATGQGKSVGMNVIITSLLYSKHPSELKFVMIDPKILEFSIYNELEHHFFARIPSEKKCIITDTEKVVPTLLSLCQEMDDRYHLLTAAKVRNIKEYNTAWRKGELSEADGHSLMPYIVLVVDEFADLIMTGGKEIERPIARLAQKARAAGIHMILATQRPTTDVVTGTIKANFPARIAFKVFSAVDSRTILDSTGANRLIGRGDMLFYQGRDMHRIQCALVDTPETKRIVDFIAQQPGYSEPYPLPEPIEEESTAKNSISSDKLDALFEEVARAVVSSGQGSTSKIQRDFEIGFNRAGRLMDQLEKAGIVSKQMGSKPREVLVQDLDTLNSILYQIRLS